MKQIERQNSFRSSGKTIDIRKALSYEKIESTTPLKIKEPYGL